MHAFPFLFLFIISGLFAETFHYVISSCLNTGLVVGVFVYVCVCV